MARQPSTIQTSCECCGRPLEVQQFDAGSIIMCSRCVAILARYGLEPQDIRVFNHNQINILTVPNASATRKLEEFLVPNPPLVLKSGERCFYLGYAKGGKIKSQVVGYQGGHRGASVRVAKGMSYRIGGSKGTPVREDVLEESLLGTLIITDQRVILQTDRYGFELKGSELQTVNLHSDALELLVKGRQYLVLTEDTRYISKVLQLITEETIETQEAAELKETGNDETDIVKKLREYKDLLDEGIISQEEFNKLKKELLDNRLK